MTLPKRPADVNGETRRNIYGAKRKGKRKGKDALRRVTKSVGNDDQVCRSFKYFGTRRSISATHIEPNTVGRAFPNAASVHIPCGVLGSSIQPLKDL